MLDLTEHICQMFSVLAFFKMGLLKITHLRICLTVDTTNFHKDNNKLQDLRYVFFFFQSRVFIQFT